MRQLVAIAAVAVAVGSGCSGEERVGDASARLACGHYDNVRGDAESGVLNFQELRGKVQEIHGSARVSEHPGIAEGAEKMLRGITQNDTDTFSEGARQLTEACETVDA